MDEKMACVFCLNEDTDPASFEEYGFVTGRELDYKTQHVGNDLYQTNTTYGRFKPHRYLVCRECEKKSFRASYFSVFGFIGIALLSILLAHAPFFARIPSKWFLAIFLTVFLFVLFSWQVKHFGPLPGIGGDVVGALRARARREHGSDADAKKDHPVLAWTDKEFSEFAKEKGIRWVAEKEE